MLAGVFAGHWEWGKEMEDIKSRRGFLKDACRAGVLATVGPILNAATTEELSMIDDLDRYDFILARVRFDEGLWD